MLAAMVRSRASSWAASSSASSWPRVTGCPSSTSRLLTRPWMSFGAIVTSRPSMRPLATIVVDDGAGQRCGRRTAPAARISRTPRVTRSGQRAHLRCGAAPRVSGISTGGVAGDRIGVAVTAMAGLEGEPQTVYPAPTVQEAWISRGSDARANAAPGTR